MKKKKIIIWSIVLAFLILFFPVRIKYKDGGTIEYKSLTYKVKKYHTINNYYKLGYMTGTEIEILGNTIYKNIANPDVENYNETMERIIKINGELYYEVKHHFNFLCEESKNKITSVVNLSQIPIKDNQSNFEGETYTFVYKNIIVRVCNQITKESIFLKKKKISEEREELIVNKDQTIDIESDFIKSLYNKVNPSYDANVVKEMFTDTEKFSNKYLIATGIMGLIKEKEYLNEEFIDEIDVENSIKKIFGNNITFTHEDTYIIGNDIYDNAICGYNYLKDSQRYQLMHGCSGNWFETFKRKLIYAEQNGDYIYLKEKSIYKYHDGEIGTAGTVYIYNNFNREKLIQSFKIDANEHYGINLEDYIEEASTYIYIFKKYNDDYILEKIVKE